jgi:hypothetical protein
LPGSESERGLGRRDLVSKAAGGIGIAWVTPMLLHQPAFAQAGTAKCRATASVSCWVKDCLQGNKYLPGFQLQNVNVTCPCATGTSVSACIRVTAAGEVSATTTILVYRDVASCNPASGGNDNPLTLPSAWNPYPPSQRFFIGKERSGGGAIPALPNGTYFVNVCLSTASCPGIGPTSAFACAHYRITIGWNSATNQVTSCTTSFLDNGTTTCGCSSSPPC